MNNNLHPKKDDLFPSMHMLNAMSRYKIYLQPWEKWHTTSSLEEPNRDFFTNFETQASLGHDFDTCYLNLQYLTTHEGEPFTHTDEFITEMKRIHSMAPIYLKSHLVKVITNDAMAGNLDSLQKLMTILETGKL